MKVDTLFFLCHDLTLGVDTPLGFEIQNSLLFTVVHSCARAKGEPSKTDERVHRGIN